MKDYVGIMEQLAGCRIITDGRQRRAFYCRAVVAYVMATDGYTETAIASVVRRHHTTVHYYKRVVADTLAMPESCPDIIVLFNRYKKLI